jgi:hypothetical protein
MVEEEAKAKAKRESPFTLWLKKKENPLEDLTIVKR